jgi:two-component system, LytTR family, sensor kinase
MVVIEIINYTFFIVGEFSFTYLSVFSYNALTGVVLTHLFKKILHNLSVFSNPTSTIWFTAIGSTLFLSSVQTAVSVIPSFITNYDETISSFSFISVIGNIINWMRYIGVWMIIYFMYHLLERNRAIERDKLISENLAKGMELELLLTQLNPHFLFNALNSIKALVSIDPEKSKDAIIKLSELLRFTLNYGMHPLIPLNDELLEVKKYLGLEQIRFGDRLHVTFEISDDSLNQMIPPAIILTLAENAIKHGVTTRSEISRVLVKTDFKDGRLSIQMVNPGVLKSNRVEGIGLRTIHKRLKSLYGEDAHLDIVESNEIITATITMKTA